MHPRLVLFYATALQAAALLVLGPVTHPQLGPWVAAVCASSVACHFSLLTGAHVAAPMCAADHTAVAALVARFAFLSTRGSAAALAVLASYVLVSRSRACKRRPSLHAITQLIGTLHLVLESAQPKMGTPAYEEGGLWGEVSPHP